MPRRDIIVVGASAGGVRALQALVGQFDADTSASIFVVLHLRPEYPSLLPHVLQPYSALPVAQPTDVETIEHGRIYVAPPDRHLLVEFGHLHLSVAPRENRARPAINPLFRSAALAYGTRVIGVILSGMLDDGTAGLWEIKRRGGIAVVQTPEDAEYGQMPTSAMANVPVDYRVPVSDMGALLADLIARPPLSAPSDAEIVMPEPTRLTCPDCHGPIQRFRFGPITEYKCRVGHAFSPESMLAAHEDAEERALWSAIETLEEGADLADEVRSQNASTLATAPRRNGARKRKTAKAIRTAIEETKLERREDG